MIPKTKVTITNVFGPLNRGDFELFEQLARLLPNTEIHAIARDPSGASSYFPSIQFHPQPGTSLDRNGRSGRILAAIRTLALVSSAHIPLAGFLLPAAQRSSLNVIRESALVIACPGGYLTNATHSYYPQVAQIYFAAARAKKLWLAPMSIGPAERLLERKFLKLALEGAESVYVRETWSQRFCRELGIDSVISTDLAFLPARDLLEALPRPAANCIAATIVRWNFPDSSNADKAAEQYHRAMAEVLDRTSERLNLPVKLLLQVDNDRAVTERVARLMSAEVEIVRVDTPEEYRSILSAAAIMFGSRFHSAVFSMSVGTPTVVISYLPKGRYMMEDMGLRELVIDIEDVTADALDEMAQTLTRNDRDLRHRSQSAIKELLTEIRNPFITRLEERLKELANES